MNKTRNVQDFYKEKYKTSLGNIKALNTRKDILCLWMKRLNLMNISVFSEFFLSMKTSIEF